MTIRRYRSGSILAFIASSLLCSMAQADESRELNLDQQPLADALKSVANEFDLEIAFFSDTTNGIEAVPLAGNYTQEQAFDALLGDTVLEYTQLDNGTVVVRAKGQGGDSDSGNVSQQPVMMAQNQSSQAQTTISGRSSEGGTSIVTGNVIDARTGANLKGAKVTIEETGQWTSTNDLGEFRLVNVPTGSATLTVSYLGYAGQSAIVGVRGDVTSQDFALRGGSEIEEIVVFGQRSARALSLNRQRTAPNNSEVVSADTLGNFPGTTVSEALRRVSGVSFQQDPVTGEGSNIIVRGIQPDMNTVRLNGVRVPDGSGVGRAGDLRNILADSISSITVHKTLLPSHDSSGVGGVVDIETKSPLDRERRYVSVSVEGGERSKGFSSDFLGSATVSGRFGDSEDFGLSASVQYREQDFDNLSYSNGLAFGLYLPLEADGSTSIVRRGQVDPRSPFPFESNASDAYPTSLGAGVRSVQSSNLTATLSGEWAINEHTSIQLDLQQTRAERDSFSFDISHSAFHSYQPRSVAALGGEVRSALGFDGSMFSSHNYILSADDDRTTYASFRGESSVHAWDIGYSAGYTRGENRIPTFRSLSFNIANPLINPADISAAAIDPVEGRVVSLFGRANEGPQLPLLTQGGIQGLNDPNNYLLGFGAETGGIKGFNERLSAELDARYTFGGNHLRSVEFGFYSEAADFGERSDTNIESPFFLGLGATAADLTGRFENDVLGRIGVENGVASLTQSGFVDVFNTMSQRAGSGDQVLRFSSPSDPLFNSDRTRETERAAYFESAFEFGKWEIIGGVRVTEVDVSARKVRFPDLILADGTRDFVFQEEFTTLVELSDSTIDVLPRLLVNYRPSEDRVLRGGYFLSVARPTLDDLSGAPNIALNLTPIGGPDFNQPTLLASQGDPALSPAISHNMDLGAELYSETIGIIKIGVFYKRIDNFLQSNANVGSTAYRCQMILDFKICRTTYSFW